MKWELNLDPAETKSKTGEDRKTLFICFKSHSPKTLRIFEAPNEVPKIKIFSFEQQNLLSINKISDLMIPL